MSDIREILVAVDFSGGSKAALAYAAVLARRTQCVLRVLHVWQVPEFVPLAERSGDAALESLGKLVETGATQELARFVAAAKSEGIPIEQAFAVPGVPSSTIVETARQRGCELLVLGTHGRTGIAHVLVGSVAERVVRRAPCPVVTVREAAPKPPSFQRILVPVDYSESSLAALEYATTLASSVGAELDVVHVWDRPAYVSGDVVVHGQGGVRRSLSELIRESAEAGMKDFLASSAAARAGSVPVSHRLLAGEPAATLVAELDKGAHGLVVVGTHGRTGVKHLLLGSVAEKLVRHAPIPVLTVPPVRQPAG